MVMVVTFRYLLPVLPRAWLGIYFRQRRSPLPLVGRGVRPSRVVQAMALWNRRPNPSLKRTHTGGRRLVSVPESPY